MTQADAPMPPESEIATLSASQICLLHNIRDDSALDEDFIESIRSQGILNRVIVKRGPCEHDAEFVAIAGHRRIQAEGIARSVTSVSVPVEIVDESRELDVVFMLVENLQRKDIEPLEEARAYAELVREHHWSQAEVAQSVGKSPSHVSERIALLGLPDKAKAMIADGSLPLRAAAKLTKLPHDTVDAVLAKPGPKTEQWIDNDIASAKTAIEKADKVTKAIAQYASEGWMVLRAAPKDAHEVRVTDAGSQMAKGLKLNLTMGKFKKEPGALLVVKTATAYGSTKPDLHFYTTDLARYAEGGANEAAATAAPAKDTSVDEELARKAEILTHRQEWFRTFVRGKVENKVILERLTPVLWTSLVEREATEMAVALGLFAEGEATDDITLARQRLRAHIEGKKIGDQLRICYLARFAHDLDAGLHRWDDLRVPQTLLDAGYEPTAVEQELLDQFRVENATRWAEFREGIVTEFESIAEGDEMQQFLDACGAAELLGETPDDFEHPPISEMLDTWDQREQDAATEDEDDDEPEPEMTGGEAIGEEHAGE